MKEWDEGMRSSAEVSLIRLFDECPATHPLAPYQSDIRQWAATYLTAPHPELGREGPVCPFTGPSIDKKMFWVGCLDQPDTTAADVERTAAGMISTFKNLPPADGPDALLKTILILFPAVTAYNVIDEAQQRLKDAFVSTGLMIGQFYPGCEAPGIRNPWFRPLRSPVPLLAIRRMVSSDFPFLAAKVEWIEEYLRRFAPSIPAAVRKVMATGFDARSVQRPGESSRQAGKA